MAAGSSSTSMPVDSRPMESDTGGSVSAPITPADKAIPSREPLGDAEQRRSRFRYSLTLHGGALLCVLTGLLFFASTDAVWTSDEGALLYQAQQLLGGQGWEVAHPFPAADPEGTQFPIELTVWGADGGYLPYSRHAVLVWLVGIVYAVAGYSGVIMMSVLGTVGASTAAAKLGQLVDSNSSTRTRTGIVAMWSTGLGSPMLFNSYVAWAHTLIAALLCWAFYLLVQNSMTRRTPTQTFTPSLLAGCTLIFAACLLRTEATLAGFAIGLGLLSLHRATRRPGIPVAGFLALTAAVAGFVVDKRLNPPGNGQLKPSSFDEVYGLVDGRLAGLYQTWLRPTTDTGLASLLLMLGAALMIASGVLARRYRVSSSTENQSPGPPLFAAIGFGLVVAATAILAQIGSGTVELPSVLVPGLLIAFPSLFAGLFLTTKADTKNPVLMAALLTCGLFWLSVIATQYRFGGGAEWGGRYFSATLPLVVPVAVANLQRVIDRRTTSFPLILVGLLVASQVLFGFLGLSRIRTSRSELAYLDIKVTEAERAMAGSDGAPVFVTTVPPAGRWMWQHLDDGRWLWVEPDQLEQTMDRLAELNISQVALVSLDQENDLASTDKHYRLQPQANANEPVLVLENR